MVKTEQSTCNSCLFESSHHGVLQLLSEEHLANALFTERINSFDFITVDIVDSLVNDQPLRSSSFVRF